MVEDDKNGIIKLLSEIKNKKILLKTQKCKRSDFEYLLELANDLTKITNNDTTEKNQERTFL